MGRPFLRAGPLPLLDFIARWKRPFFDAWGRTYYYKEHLSNQYQAKDETPVPCRIEQANLVSSLCKDGRHRPVIDLDRQGLQLIHSSTPGNYHLYIDTPMSWDTYKRLLEVLLEAKMVEEKWVKESLQRQMSFVRPMWIKKQST